jgi:hypothetical protein
MRQEPLDELALEAATAWLEWEPKEGDPVGCPGPVADAVTEWAHALLEDWNRPIDVPMYEP